MVNLSKNLFDFKSKLSNASNLNERKVVEADYLIHKTPFDQWVDVSRIQWDKKAKDSAVYKRSHYYNTETGGEDDDEILHNMDAYERIRFFEDFLENKFKIDRELFQREVHDMCVAVLAHLIVGPEWKFIGKDIVKDRGWDTLVKSLSAFAMAYRRAGKTSAIQMIAASLAILCPGISLAVFSTSKRISKVLGMGVIKMIIEAGYGDMIYTKSEEIIALRVNNNPLTERTIFMSPGNPDIYTHCWFYGVSWLVRWSVCHIYFCVHYTTYSFYCLVPFFSLWEGRCGFWFG